jgi:hypothetical protein
VANRPFEHSEIAKNFFMGFWVSYNASRMAAKHLDRATTDTNLWILSEERQLLAKSVWRSHIVGIHARDKFGVSKVESDVKGVDDSLRFGESYFFYSWISRAFNYFIGRVS